MSTRTSDDAVAGWPLWKTVLGAFAVLVAGVLVVVYLVHLESVKDEQRRATELHSYNFDVPVMSAAKLQKAFDDDFATASAALVGKRFLVYGRILDSKEDTDYPTGGGWAMLTAGTADERDPGDRYIQLMAAPPWSSVLGNLATGSYVTANCVVSTIQNVGGGFTVIGSACNSVSPGLGAPSHPRSPFAD